MQSLSSRVQIFDHPMKYQPILDHLWEKYADLIEQTNTILVPHGEKAKEIVNDNELDSDEEQPVQQETETTTTETQQQTSSGWSKHVGHGSQAQFKSSLPAPVPTTAPLIPTVMPSGDSVKVETVVETKVESPQVDEIKVPESLKVEQVQQ